MTTDPEYWYRAGLADRAAGNSEPGIRDEDFYREIEDPVVARTCAEAYKRGFRQTRT